MNRFNLFKINNKKIILKTHNEFLLDILKLYYEKYSNLVLMLRNKITFSAYILTNIQVEIQ